MQRMRILPNNEANRDEPRCSSPFYYTGVQIINVPYHIFGCDSTSRKYLRNNDTFYDSFKQIITQGQLNKSSKAPIGLSSSTVMIAVLKSKNYIYFLYLYYFSISVRKIKMITLYSSCKLRLYTKTVRHSIFLVIQTVLPHDGKQPCDPVEHTNFRPNANDGMDKK